MAKTQYAILFGAKYVEVLDKFEEYLRIECEFLRVGNLFVFSSRHDCVSVMLSIRKFFAEADNINKYFYNLSELRLLRITDNDDLKRLVLA